MMPDAAGGSVTRLHIHGAGHNGVEMLTHAGDVITDALRRFYASL